MAKTGRKTTKSSSRVGTSKVQHEAQCTVCNHPQRKEIDREWLKGMAGSDIAEKYNLSEAAISRHAKAEKLHSHKDAAVLRHCRTLITNAKIDEREVSDMMLSKALEMQAKITGELVEKKQVEHSGSLNLTIEQIQERQRKGLAKFFGVA